MSSIQDFLPHSQSQVGIPQSRVRSFAPVKALFIPQICTLSRNRSALWLGNLKCTVLQRLASDEDLPKRRIRAMPTTRGEIMKFRTLFSATTILSILCLALSPIARAQNVYAAIHGTVTDASGAVLTNASVIIVNTSTNITTTATTDNKGYYIVPQLQIGGPYEVTIAAPGFQK